MFKPILFNTEMVKAIRDGRKTQTRRVAKELCGLEPREDGLPPEDFKFFISPQTGWLYWCDLLKALTVDGKRVSAPVMPGDILWVRETWTKMPHYVYKADDEHPEFWDYDDRWYPSIHMPKEAARIFLCVKDVRIERLQEITDADAHAEGVPEIGDYPINPVYCPRCKGEGLIGGHTGGGYVEVDCPDCRTDVQRFSHLWDSTIKPADLDMYGWEANPWVWVIEFEQIEKLEDWK